MSGQGETLNGRGQAEERRRRARVVFPVLLIFVAVLIGRKVTGLGAWLLEYVPIVGASLPLFAVAVGVLWWRRAKGDSWADFGLVRPRSVIFLFWAGGAFAAKQLTAEIAPLLATLSGAEPNVGRLAVLEDNLPLLLFLLPAMWLVNGFGEELLIRGFVMTRLAWLWGDDRAAWIRALVVQAFFFGLGHAYQGLSGMILTMIAALIYGGVYILSGRNLWTAVIAHAASNSVAFVSVYVYGLGN